MTLADLLKNDLTAFYGITSPIVINGALVRAQEFDLDDIPGPVRPLAVGAGKVTFKDNHGELEIVNYENFINQCKYPPAFLNGRRKCDYAIVSDRSQMLLIEITSATGSVQNLIKPITNQRTGAVVFPGGKYEKAEYQLGATLQTIMQVMTISNFVNQCRLKTALMAYKVNSLSVVSTLGPIVSTYSRYLAIETRETRQNGALLSCPQIEAYGFEYRRINHNAAFHLAYNNNGDNSTLRH